MGFLATFLLRLANSINGKVMAELYRIYVRGAGAEKYANLRGWMYFGRENKKI